MWHRARRLVPGLVAVGAALAACGGSSASGPNPSSLEGTWTASKMEYVMAGGAGTRVDLVSHGATVTLAMAATHTYTLTVRMPGEADDVTTGSWSTSGDVLTTTMTGMSGERQFEMTLTGNTLNLSGADADFDFNGDGIAEAAKLSMVLTKP
jgi:Lipocalin-like domain